MHCIHCIFSVWILKLKLHAKKTWKATALVAERYFENTYFTWIFVFDVIFLFISNLFSVYIFCNRMTGLKKQFFQNHKTPIIHSLIRSALSSPAVQIYGRALPHHKRELFSSPSILYCSRERWKEGLQETNLTDTWILNLPAHIYYTIPYMCTTQKLSEHVCYASLCSSVIHAFLHWPSLFQSSLSFANTCQESFSRAVLPTRSISHWGKVIYELLTLESHIFQKGLV